jgi:OmpA-OmpF porin, OOP family
MKIRTVLLGAVAGVAISGTAQAAHFNGWYLGLEGGANWVEDAKFTPFGTFGGIITHTDTARELALDTGWTVLATAGYGLYDSNFRVEAEFGYRHNEIEGSHPVGGGVSTPVPGSLRQFTIMANVVYDVPLTPKLSLSLGAGIGVDRASLEFGTAGNEDSDWSFAYQGLAGLGYAIGSQTDLFLNYRYLRTGESEYSGILSHRLDFEGFSNHALSVGLRYDLSPEDVPTPPAAVSPAPPPTPAHYIVFFGFNKCSITAEADRVLSEAAAAAKSSNSVSVTIVGHADTVGSAEYNQKLSECRANAAKSNLVGKGIPQDAISASGKGETELLVQTADGVKEPQNRRATIDLGIGQSCEGPHPDPTCACMRHDPPTCPGMSK